MRGTWRRNGIYKKSYATFSEERIAFGRYKFVLEDNVKTNLQERGYKGEIQVTFVPITAGI
jgi:hypothetical protein